MNGGGLSGGWGIRLLIRFLTLLLGLLIFWLEGFLLRDIESIEGPRYDEIERKHIDFRFIQKQGDLAKQISDLDRDISNLREQQTLAGNSSQNLQSTINQLIELQRVSIEKQIPLSDSEKNELSTSLSHFLESQKSYQTLNQEMTDLLTKKGALDDEKRLLDEEIEQKRGPAHTEYEDLLKRHRFKLASLQLAFLLPLLFFAGYILMRWRGTLYFPLIVAFGSATLIKTGIVMHKYFPSRFFKYILILCLLVVVSRILIYLIRMIAFPKASWLAKQYREAYERFLCPVCEYPIRTGPRRFLYWTRRTVHKILPSGEASNAETPYTCPACGTVLYETCEQCQKVRHSLLAHCEHCGAAKEIAK